MTSRSNLYTKAQLERLRSEYAVIEMIDPDSATYQLLLQHLDSLPQHLLAQLAGSNIKFVSKLARNRVRNVA